MHLVACPRPLGALEAAPTTSLRQEAEGDRWDGFWCALDEGYYTRCTHRDGSEEWFRMADESAARAGAEATPGASGGVAAGASGGVAAGAPLRARAAAGRGPTMLFVTGSVNARGVLVGTAHRKSR